MSLRQRAHDALIIDSDIECAKALNILRKECRAKGLDPERVNQIIRSENHAIYNASKLPVEVKPKPPEKEPATPEPTQVIQDTRTEAELSRRAKFSGEPVKQRNDKDSMILRMADEKK